MVLNTPLSGIELLIRKLENIYVLTAREKSAVAKLPVHLRDLEGGQDIVREGDRPTQSCLVMDGFACRYKMVGDGLRQILSFHIPGDIPDLMSLHLPVMDHSLGTLATSRLGLISHESIRRLIQEHPRIGVALWRDTLIDGSIFREWLVGNGRRNAHSRTAHLFCEIVTRMEVVGLAQDKSIRIPITQGAVADALGLTAVHVNRVARDLRIDGLVTWRGKNLEINDWERLKQVGGFDPTYLHLASK